MIFWMNILGALGFVVFLLGILISCFSNDFLGGIFLIPIFIFLAVKWLGSSYYDLDLNYKKFVSGRKVKTNEIPYILYSRYSTFFGQKNNVPILGLEFEDKEWVLGRLLVSKDSAIVKGKTMCLEDGMGDILFKYSQVEEGKAKLKRYSPELTQSESIVLAQLRAIIRDDNPKKR